MILNETESILIQIIDAITQGEASKLKEISEVNKKESYPYIPIGFGNILRSLLLVKQLILKDLNIPKFDHWSIPETGKPKFIDYGAGTGVNMYLALLMGFKPDGIEIDEKTLRSSEFTKYSHLNLMKGDLNDDTIYKKNKYDVVFFYSPFHDHLKEIKFELNAISTVKIGGYVIPPSPGKMTGFFNCYKKNDRQCIRNDRQETILFYNKMKDFEQVNESVFHSSIFKRIK